MASAAAAVAAASSLTPEKCCLASLPAAVSTTRAPQLHLPLRPFRHLHLSVSPLRRTSPFTLLVARTSEAEQEEGQGGWENGEEDVEEWQKGPEAALEGEEEEFGGEGEVVSEGVEEEEEGSGVEEESYPEPPEDAKLFVGNLPYDMDSEGLAKLFDQAGVVEIAEVIYNRETDQSRGFGFITMSTVEEAEKAVEMFNRYDCNGRLLTVNKAAPRGAQPERPPREFGPSFRIYVGNLPWQVDDSRLEQVFSEHGKVVDARVVYDRETGRSRGFGFVTMSGQAEVDDAIAALDGQSLDGRALRVNVAEERPRRNF